MRVMPHAIQVGVPAHGAILEGDVGFEDSKLAFAEYSRSRFRLDAAVSKP